VQHFVTASVGHVFGVLEGVACTDWDVLGVGGDDGVGVDDSSGLTIEMLGVGTTTVDQFGIVMTIDEEGKTLIVLESNGVDVVGVDKEVGDELEEDDEEEEAVLETGFMVPPCPMGLLIGIIVCVGTTVTVLILVTVAVAPAVLDADVGQRPSMGKCGK
jgi:hypothetical protein